MRKRKYLFYHFIVNLRLAGVSVDHLLPSPNIYEKWNYLFWPLFEMQDYLHDAQAKFNYLDPEYTYCRFLIIFANVIRYAFIRIMR